MGSGVGWLLRRGTQPLGESGGEGGEGDKGQAGASLSAPAGGGSDGGSGGARIARDSMGRWLGTHERTPAGKKREI